MIGFDTEDIFSRTGITALIGDRWTNLILLVLETGEARHSDLKRVLGELSDEQAISQRVLTQKLRNLERHGFIDWIGDSQQAIETARSRYDSN